MSLIVDVLASLMNVGSSRGMLGRRGVGALGLALDINEAARRDTRKFLGCFPSSLVIHEVLYKEWKQQVGRPLDLIVEECAQPASQKGNWNLLGFLLLLRQRVSEGPTVAQTLPSTNLQHEANHGGHLDWWLAPLGVKVRQLGQVRTFVVKRGASNLYHLKSASLTLPCIDCSGAEDADGGGSQAKPSLCHHSHSLEICKLGSVLSFNAVFHHQIPSSLEANQRVADRSMEPTLTWHPIPPFTPCLFTRPESSV